MGMNLRNITDVINLGTPTTFCNLLRQIVHAGRDLSSGWTYIENLICVVIASEVDDDSSAGSGIINPTSGSKVEKRVNDMDSNLYKITCPKTLPVCF